MLRDEQLTALNPWPVGTKEYQQEEALLELLNHLGQMHGYGRVAQLAAQLAVLEAQENHD